MAQPGQGQEVAVSSTQQYRCVQDLSTSMLEKVTRGAHHMVMDQLR